jgi:para-nitrobenzyl esterase
MKLKFIIILLYFSSNLLGQNLVIKTANGSIEGYFNQNKTIRIFKGVPFATPPIGNLRWKAPQPSKNWNGVLKCKSYSASPMQNKPVPFMCWSEEFIAQPEPLSEDCLYLNIWAATKTKKEKLPVFVWIYGGGLSSGSANCAIYDGEEMAKKGVIFVSINYRVGVFGFMAHPELSKESPYNTSGNYGFLDQMEALRWIQKNIAKFGGDPNNVTIAGQSAGSFSVNALVASPLAKGLFHKAIAQSGGLLSNKMSNNLAYSEKQGEAFMQKAKATNIIELRNRTSKEIQELSQGNFRFGTTLDNYVLPLDLLQNFEKGLFNEVPLLTGWVTGDGALMGNESTTIEKFTKDAQNTYGNNTNDFLQIFNPQTDEEAKVMKTKIGMFQFASLPSHLWAGFNKKQKSYLYQFSHVPPDKANFPNYGAFHTSEVPYALHTLKKWNRSWQSLDWNLEDEISSYWVNFAKTGNPNGKDLPLWKSYEKETGYIMELGEKTILREALIKKELDFLEKTLK